VIGSSVAYWLSLDPALRGKILVVERDNSYAKASTALSAASIRLQFSNQLNVAISKFGAEFIRNFRNLIGVRNGNYDLGFKENGYLFLANTIAQSETLRRNQAVQRAGGADTVLLTQEAIKSRFPFLNVNDISLASLGEHSEGWFDNMGLLNGLKLAAKSNGVKYLNAEVTAISSSKSKVISIQLDTGIRISADTFVNAAGPRAAQIAKFAGVDLPVEPRKRTTFVLHSHSPAPPKTPLIVDYSGVYIKPEGEYWMCACQPEIDPTVDFDDFEPNHQDFENIIWPKIAARSEIFEAVKVMRFWAGHYAYNTLDQNAIVGSHPELTNFYFANGFSGHGLQQAPAVGRGISELILSNNYQTLDLSDLGFERIISNQPFTERNIV